MKVKNILRSILSGALAFVATSAMAGAVCDESIASVDVASDLPAVMASNDTIQRLLTEEQARFNRSARMFGRNGSRNFDPTSVLDDPFGEPFNRPYMGHHLEGEQQQRQQQYYRNRKWYNDLFVGAGVGYNNVAPLSGINFDGTLTYHVYAGYQFQSRNNLSIHALRLSAGFGHYTTPDLPESLWGVDVGLDYMFNLSTFVGGNNPKRWVDVSMVFGVGYMYTRTSEWSTTAWRPRFGINIDRRLSGNSHFFVEPYIFVIDDRYDNSGMNPRVYDVHWGIQGGVRIDMNNNESVSRLYMPHFNPNPFYDFGVGFNGYWMGDVKTSVRRSMGANYQVSVGRWLDPLLGARVAVHASDFYWRGTGTAPSGYGNTLVHPGMAVFNRGAVAAGRLELMVQPMNLFRRWRVTPRDFELDLFAGFEVGMYAKGKVPGYGRLSTTFIGYTGGIDVLYKIAPGTQIFVEPRFLLSNFSVRKAYKGREGNFTDKLASLNVGLRVQRPNVPEREPFFTDEPRQAFELGITAGSTKFLRKDKQQVSYPFNWNAGLSFTYHVDAYHAAMLEFEYNRLNKQYMSYYEIASGSNMMRYNGYVTTKLNFACVKLAYRLNLTSLFIGDIWRRHRFNLYMFAGPTYSRHLRTSHELSPGELSGGTGEPHIYAEQLKDKEAWGCYGGFIASYNLTKQLSVNIRPEGHYISSNHFLGRDAIKHGVVLKIDAGLEWRF